MAEDPLQNEQLISLVEAAEYRPTRHVGRSRPGDAGTAAADLFGGGWGFGGKRGVKKH